MYTTLLFPSANCVWVKCYFGGPRTAKSESQSNSILLCPCPLLSSFPFLSASLQKHWQREEGVSKEIYRAILVLGRDRLTPYKVVPMNPLRHPFYQLWRKGLDNTGSSGSFAI